MPRIILRRDLTIKGPRPYVHKWGMTLQQWTYFNYRLSAVLVYLDMSFKRARKHEEYGVDVGYCLDSQVDAVHPNRDRVLILSQNFPVTQRTERDLKVLNASRTREVIQQAVVTSSSWTTNPRPPGYVPGSFGGNRGRATRY